MKKVVVSFLLIFVVLIAFTCNNSTAEFEKKKTAYIENTEIKLKQFEDRLIALRERADNILTEESETFSAQIDSLSKLQNKAENILEKAKISGKDDWEKLKNSVDEKIAQFDSFYEKSRDW